MMPVPWYLLVTACAGRGGELGDDEHARLVGEHEQERSIWRAWRPCRGRGRASRSAAGTGSPVRAGTGSSPAPGRPGRAGCRCRAAGRRPGGSWSTSMLELCRGAVDPDEHAEGEDHDDVVQDRGPHHRAELPAGVEDLAHHHVHAHEEDRGQAVAGEGDGDVVARPDRRRSSRHQPDQQRRREDGHGDDARRARP